MNFDNRRENYQTTDIGTAGIAIVKIVGIALLVYVAGISIFLIYNFSTTKSKLLSYGISEATGSLVAWVVMLIAIGIPTIAILRIFIFRARTYDYAAAMILPLISWGIAQMPANFDAKTGKALKFCSYRPDNSLFCLDHAGIDPITQQKLIPMNPNIAEVQFRKEKGLSPKRVTQPVADIVFFDPLTAQPKVWVHKNDQGCFHMFDNPGADPQSGELLLPITKEIVRLIKECSNNTTKSQPQSNVSPVAEAPSGPYMGVALVFDPPSNVRRTPNGSILCSINSQQTIKVGANQGGWYSTDACGSPGVIHFDQLRF
jgi:hypothetical protein